MSKWITKTEKSVLPFYAAGLAALVCGALLPVYRLWALGVTAAVTVGVWLAAAKVCPDRVTRYEQPFLTGRDDADELLAAIDTGVKQLRQLNDAIPDDALSASIARMEKAGAGILAELQHDPSKAPRLRRFANHYLPDAVKILSLYARLDAEGVKGANARAAQSSVEANAASIATAFENQLDALFEAEALDLDTDLAVLQNMLKGQGLG